MKISFGRFVFYFSLFQCIAMHAFGQGSLIFEVPNESLKFTTVHPLNNGDILVNCNRLHFSGPILIEGGAQNSLYRVASDGTTLWNQQTNDFFYNIYEAPDGGLFSLYSHLLWMNLFYTCDITPMPGNYAYSYFTGYGGSFTKKNASGVTLSTDPITSPLIFASTFESFWTLDPIFTSSCGERKVHSSMQLSDGSVVIALDAIPTTVQIGMNYASLGGLLRYDPSGTVLSGYFFQNETMQTSSFFMGNNGNLHLAFRSNNALLIQDLGPNPSYYFPSTTPITIPNFFEGAITEFKVHQLDNGNIVVMTGSPILNSSPSEVNMRTRVLNNVLQIINDQSLISSSVSSLIYIDAMDKFCYAKGNNMNDVSVQLIEPDGNYGTSYTLANTAGYIPTSVALSGQNVVVGGHFNCCLDGQQYTEPAKAFVYLAPDILPYPQYEYTITAETNNDLFGMVSGGGVFNWGVSCTLSAVANSGYEFVGWYLNGVLQSNDASYSFAVNSNATYVAVFEPISFEVQLISNFSNAATLTGAGMYSAGANAGINVTPNYGYVFYGWYSNGVLLSTSEAFSFTVESDTIISAVFHTQLFEISVNANNSNGGATSGEGTFSYLTENTLIAIPNAGYQFVGWFVDGVLVSNDATYEIVVLSDSLFVAHFEAIDFVVQLESNINDAGNLSGGGFYQYNSNCTISAEANYGYEFVGWYSNGVLISSSETYEFVVQSDTLFVSHFEAVDFVVQLESNINDAGNLSGGGIYQYNSTCTISVEANYGYTFVGWYSNGVLISNSEYYDFIVESDISFTAHFEPLEFQVTLVPNVFGAGQVSGAGWYAFNTTCNISAIPNVGFIFSGFYENSNLISIDNPYSFAVTESIDIIAMFETDNNSGLSQKESNSIKIFPNPFSDKLEIQSEIPIQSLVVRDLNGRTVLVSNQISQNELHLDFVENGMYILEVTTAYGSERFHLVKLE